MYFQKPGRKSEQNLEEVLKILNNLKKFRKPGEYFQKTFGHLVCSLYKKCFKIYLLKVFGQSQKMFNIFVIHNMTNKCFYKLKFFSCIY